eukprot:NODE_21698_length_741_cov_1.576547.p1 GENE.NODE_21698_length_741_cov_1.576547~~NODE_21698_length_741_cov_1.576547.p1  ORF type:complete len:69 (-),score=31.39 NODE_21698_length_741_cov_1.576547:369-575(-)
MSNTLKFFQDPSFVEELLGSLPGVDTNDPRIQEALKELNAKDEDKEKEKGKDEDKDKPSGGDGSGSAD